MSNVTVMKANERDTIRRFINLLDVLYEYGVRFICSAAATPDKLFVGSDDPFKRADTNGAGGAAAGKKPARNYYGEGVPPNGDKLWTSPYLEVGSAGGQDNTRVRSASAPAAANREDEGFASSRAVSRMIEMQTEEYLRGTASKRAKALGLE